MNKIVQFPTAETKGPANRIAELRKDRRKTQAQVAELLDCHWITISKLERGEIALTHEWMIKLAWALGARPFQFVLDDDDVAMLEHLERNHRPAPTRA